MSFRTFNHSIAHTIQSHIYMAQFPLSFSPLASPPFCSPFVSPSTYLAPSSCDRNRPPQSQAACKLTPFAPPFTQLSHPFQIPKPQLSSAEQRRPREYSGSCYPEHAECTKVWISQRIRSQNRKYFRWLFRGSDGFFWPNQFKMKNLMQVYL
jgi:hypothetical protein